MKTLILMCALMCACSGSYTVVKLPDMSNGAIISCHTKADCFRQSTLACKDVPYSVLENADGVATNDFAFHEHGMMSYVIRCAVPSDKEDAAP